MSEAPERIWAITEPDDISADILGEVYAQQIPDGMNGTPVEYVRADRIEELEAENADLKDKLAKAVHRFAAKAVRSMTQVDEAFENWNKKQDEEAFIKLGAALVSNHETLAELTGGKDE